MVNKKMVLSISIPLVETILLQSKDESVRPVHRGAPLTRKFGGPVFLGTPVNDITHADFQETLSRYVSDRPNRRSGWKFVEEFNALMRWAVLRGIRTTPWGPFNRPHKESLEMDLLEPHGVQKVLDAVDTIFPLDTRIQIVIRALVLLGIGVREACEFSFSQVDFIRHEYHQADMSGRYRIIPIPAEMEPLILAALQQRNAGQRDFMRSGAWFSIQELSSVVRQLRNHCGFKRLVPSTLVRTALRGK